MKNLVCSALICAAFAMPAPALSPTPTVTGIQNNASFTTALSPGALAAIYGSDLAPTSGNTTVMLGSKACFVSFVSATQVNVQLPVNAGAGTFNLVVSHDGMNSVAFRVTLTTYSPAIFTVNGSGSGPGTFYDGSTLVSPSAAAKIGDSVSGYGIGLGATNPVVATGTAASTTTLTPTVTKPTVTVGGVPATVTFSGLAPGQIGFYQVNFVIPEGVVIGAPNTVIWTIGEVSSPPVTIQIFGVPTTTTLMSPGASSYGQAVTLTAMVTPSTATGKVTFYDGTTVLGTSELASGSASVTTTFLPSGKQSLTALYGGDNADERSVSLPLSQTVSPVTANDFAPPAGYIAGSTTSYAAVGDFDGDGKQDLVVVNYEGAVNVLLGNGDGTFQTAKVTSSGIAGANDITTGDFDGDGKTDIVLTIPNGYVSVMLGKGDGTFQPAVEYSAGLLPVSVEVADFNGDGKADLVVANNVSSGGGFINVLLGNGDGTFQTTKHYAAGTLPTYAAVGDFDRDGKADIAVGDNGSVNILLGNGDGTFQPFVTLSYTGAANNATIVVGDFDGDGKLDLAAGGTNGIGILLGNGDGTFQPGVLYTAGGGPMVSGDFNGDGKPDLAIGGFYVLLGNGDGTFQAAQRYAVGKGIVSLVTGDFNRDGRADLALADEDLNSNGQNTEVMLGTLSAGTAQTIMFGPLSNVSFGVTPFKITATASSGLTVVFTSTTPTVCTVGPNPNMSKGSGGGTAVTTVGGGLCTINADQPGNAQYPDVLPAATVMQSFTVSAPTPQTITFGPLSDEIMGSTPPPLSATATSGLGVMFASNSMTICTLSGVNITLVAPGVCSITASQPGGSSYGPATPVIQTFTVSAAGIQPVAAFLDQNGAPALTFNNSMIFPDAGGYLIGAPAVTQDLNGNAYVIGLDSAGGVHLNSYSFGNSSWNGWQYSGGILDTSSGLTAAVDPSGIVWFTGRDIGDRYWINSWNGTSFGGWILVADGILAHDSIPQIAIPSDGTIYVVGKDIGGRIWSNSYNPTSQTFTGWVDRQAVMIGQPSVTAGQDGMVYVAVRSVSTDSPVYVTQIPAQNAATANTWLNGGGQIDTDPQITSQGGTVYLLAEAGGDTVYVLTFAESTQIYGSWSFTNGTLNSATIAAAAGSVFIAGLDGSDRVYWYSLTGNSWFFAGGAGISSTVLAGGK